VRQGGSGHEKIRGGTEGKKIQGCRSSRSNAEICRGHRLAVSGRVEIHKGPGLVEIREL
jgi:hypothetical protein